MTKQIHLLGTGLRTNLLAHALSGLKHVPGVRVLTPLRKTLSDWHDEGRCFNVIRNGAFSSRSDPVLEYISRSDRAPLSKTHIDHLIVTLPAVHTTNAMKRIAHRIDQYTTICLVQDGLGVDEELNREVFPDPQTRPHYILGHMSQSLAYVKLGGKHYRCSVQETNPGTLALTALSRASAQFSRLKFLPPNQRNPRVGHLLQTLATAPDLGAGLYPLETFMMRKLPDMVFRSVIDPLSVMLDGSYSQVYNNPRSMQLMDQLLGEISQVLLALPELRGSNWLWRYVRDGKIRKDCFSKLLQRQNSDNPMLQLVREGRKTDIAYLNGWFVKRGREVGIQCAMNQMLIAMVTAKQQGHHAESQALIRFQKYISE